ncbi:MAG: hypothetical protein CBB90_13550 [Gammaproteobacteria bacterium TMED30]|nr:MAG: hypothetical protein CBB90_13550 [Gammaproteobacteria bacterium TMED30]
MPAIHFEELLGRLCVVFHHVFIEFENPFYTHYVTPSLSSKNKLLHCSILARSGQTGQEVGDNILHSTAFAVEQQATGTSKLREFKKYPNRRIYDLDTSKYVNLEYLADLILAGSSIKVKKADSEEDITQLILLQILADKEKEDSAPLLTNLALEQLIRFASNPYTRAASAFIEQTLEFLAQQNEIFFRNFTANRNASNFNAFQDAMRFWTNK